MAKVGYEWACEEWTEDRSDVLENYFDERVSRCLQTSKQLETFSIVLVRDVYCETEGLIERSWAYVDNGELPEEFTGGAKVPKRFVAELAKALKNV